MIRCKWDSRLCAAVFSCFSDNSRAEFPVPAGAFFACARANCHSVWASLVRFAIHSFCRPCRSPSLPAPVLTFLPCALSASAQRKGEISADICTPVPLEHVQKRTVQREKALFRTPFLHAFRQARFAGDSPNLPALDCPFPFAGHLASQCVSSLSKSSHPVQLRPRPLGIEPLWPSRTSFPVRAARSARDTHEC